MSEVPPSIDLIITMLSGVGANSHVQVTRALAGVVKLHQQQIAALMGNQPPPAGSPDANGDLTEEELKCVLARACCAKGPCPNCSCRAGREIQRHRTAQAASKERVMEVVRDACLALLTERKLYIVTPYSPTIGEMALEAYGHGKACDAAALLGDDLQAVLTTIASRVADQLATPAEQCSRCGRQESPTCCAEPPHRAVTLVALSAEERQTAITLRQTIAEFVFLPEVPRVLALLDRLLGGKP